jgi:NlpC/P60 family
MTQMGLLQGGAIVKPKRPVPNRLVIAGLAASALSLSLSLAAAAPASADARAAAAAGAASHAGFAGTVRAVSARPDVTTPPDLAVPVVLTYTANTSDEDTCTGECTEWGYPGDIDWDSYTQTASATVSASITLKGSDDTDELDGNGQLNEGNVSFQSSGSYSDGDCSGTSTVGIQGGTTPGTASAGLSADEDKADLDLDWGTGDGPLENVLVSTYDSCNGTSSYTTTIEDAMGDIENVDDAVGPTGTGWKIDPDWSAKAGETYATKTVDATIPWPDDGQADVGEMKAKQTWKVGCPDAKTDGERVVCIAEIAVYGLPLRDWHNGTIPYSWGGGHPKIGPSLGTCRDYTGPDADNCKDFQQGPEHTVGLDCSGFTRWVYDIVYGKDVLGDGQNGSQHDRPGMKIADEPALGDLVFFKRKVKVKDKKTGKEEEVEQWYHVAIFIGSGWTANETQTLSYADFTRIGHRKPVYYTYKQ